MSIGADPRIGTELAGYRIEALLGRGGMSVVYLAEDLSLERKVALKLLMQDLAQDEHFRERFLRESKLAASIDHSNIVPIHEAGEAEGLLYIAMRYVEGTDLASLLAQEGRLGPSRTVSLLDQVASALDAAHARGLIHRDVKPGNILLTEEAGREHVYLSDFGLTKHTGEEGSRSLTETGQFVGTIDYVAPEQIEGKAIGQEADVYSLGCVLFECLTGEAPYRAESRMGVLWAHLQATPPKPSERNPELPAGIDSVIARAMATAPGERYPSCRGLLEEARRDLAISEVAEAPPAPAPRSRPRLALYFAILLAVLAAAIAVPLVVLTGGDSAAEATAPPIIESSSAVRIDPATNEVVASVKVGEGPAAVAVSEQAVWVGNVDDETVSRIDLGTNTVTRTVSVRHQPWALAVGEGAVWVAGSAQGEGRLSELDPQNGRVRRSVALELSDPDSLAAGEGAVWVTGGGIGRHAVLRIDPQTAEVIATIPIPPREVTDPISGASVLDPTEPSGIAVGAGAVWLAGGGEQERYATVVSRIDPATNRVVATIETPDAFGVVIDGSGGVWTTGPGQAVSRIDPATNELAATISVPNPVGIMVVEEDVWISGPGDRVTHVDVGREEIVAVVDLGRWAPEGQQVLVSGEAAGEGSVWVTIR